jgi:molybdopterin converting factor small subunit
MSLVRIPPTLRSETGERAEVEIEATTVGEALVRLTERFPSLEQRILSGGQLPRFLNVFVDGIDIRILDQLESRVEPNSTIILLPAVAGG